jgi:hypothetical protein
MKPEHLRQLAADVPVPKDADLLDLRALCERQLNLEDRVAQVENLLKELKEQLRHVAETEIPAKMAQLGLVKLQLTEGHVALKPFINAKLLDEQQAHAWLEKNGFADLIKHVLTLNFTKGEAEKARLAHDGLVGLGFTPEDKEAVHPSTLKAFVKEQLAQGQPLPPDLFSVYVGQRAVIERSDKK